MSNKIKQIKDKVERIFQEADVVRASVFGSFARNEETIESDIDFLIEFKEPKGPLYLARLKMDLEEILERKVDILTYKSVNPLLREFIYKDEVKIYDQRR